MASRHKTHASLLSPSAGCANQTFPRERRVPFADLPETFKAVLYFGTNGEPIEMQFGGNGEKKITKPFEGLCPKCSDFMSKPRASSRGTGFEHS